MTRIKLSFALFVLLPACNLGFEAQRLGPDAASLSDLTSLEVNDLDVAVDGAADLTSSGDTQQDLMPDEVDESSDLTDEVDTSEVDVLADTLVDAQDTTEDVSAPVCDEQEIPAPNAIFVSVTGGDDLALGSGSSPFATLTKALDVAASTGVADVYVDEGTYTEAVRLHSTTTVHGGWVQSGASWTRDCQPNARLRTLINPTAATVFKVNGFTGAAGLENVTLVTNRAKGDRGESMIALSIVGPDVQFQATNVDITAAAGGDGALIVVPTAPGIVACGGLSDCDDGHVGSAGSAGSPGLAGSFQGNDYVPGDGGEGTTGSPGGNGVAGGPGNTDTGCEWCGSLPDCLPLGSGELTSGKGRCGCGGKPGLVGTAGKGGAASVGILVSGVGTTLTIVASVVQASNGGDASTGVIAPGALGSAGAQGTQTFCGTCVVNPSSCGLSGTNIPGGSAGGLGGMGGNSGKGGGGSGGPSLGIVLASGASVTMDGAAISVGEGGGGADGAPNGAAATTLVVP